ncbi:hypothetical protein [Saccharothrix sp. NRRL B-16348]|uniref:hypothetical protein n=1 Tax=Saccharothrix sp. NRRL B-16348 TaxID=1415542 RepID=UPI000B0EADC9|nr:hypothetical protein [Saccharothrix sp. NRRL B-16348]
MLRVLAAAALVASAFVAGVLLPEDRTHAPTPPLFAHWLPHVGIGTPLAVLVALSVVVWGPSLAGRLSWRAALGAGYGTALAWTFSLALVDGWERGFAGRLTTEHEYLDEVPGVTDVGAMLREFTSRILDYQPDSWATHVSAHPPGAFLVFIGLDRIGLSGGAWASAFVVLVGALTAVAVPVAVRAYVSEEHARAVLPFVALFPGAVWIGVSADGLFAAVAACGIALLATRRALAGGVVLGFSVFLSYGLVLMGVLALAVLLSGPRGRDWRGVGVAVLGASAVVAVFAALGFWWLDGYHLVVERYYQGIATPRAYSYWVWANLAAAVFACGFAPFAARWRKLPETARGAVTLAAAAAVAILVADVSGLSKAEVERIWLPFTVWLVVLVPDRRRLWLAAQAVTALAVNHLLLGDW